MKILYSLLISTIPFVCINAQKKPIENAWAFYSTSIPGMAMRSPNGEIQDPKPIYNRYIFIETNATGRPVIDSVYYNNIWFKAEVEQKEDSLHVGGPRFLDEKMIKLNPKKGNHLWKINLQQVQGESIPSEKVKKITIKGSVNKVKFTQNLTTETQIASLPMY